MSDKTKKTVRVVQLTDPHLGPAVDYRLAGVNTYHSLGRVLDRLSTSDDPIDAMIASGDIAGHGEIAAYQLFDQRLADVGIPYHWLPGNHDEVEVMEATLKVPFRFEVRLGNWLLLMFDSKQPGKVGGRVSEQQLAAGCAAARKHDGPVAVFVHHPPVDVNCAWLDKQKIENADEMLKQLSACGNVKAIFSGHVHQPAAARSHGIDIYTAPSTCFQFAANSAEFAFGSGGPGLRWLDLHDDGTFDTGVIQLPAVDQIDKHCVGY